MVRHRRVSTLVIVLSMVFAVLFAVYHATRKTEGRKHLAQPASPDSASDVFGQLASGATEGVADERSLMTAQAEFNALVANSPESGDPDLGDYQSAEQLMQAAQSLILTFAKDGDWVAEQMAWQVDLEGHVYTFKAAPLDILCQGCRPSASAMEAARQLDADLTRLIEDQANYAHGVLIECARDYSRHAMRKIPRSKSWSLSEQDLADRKDFRYEAITSITAGKWQYVIDFKSSDYPELESALDQLQDLKEQRKKEIVAILGG
jgi:hypothetical protein